MSGNSITVILGILAILYLVTVLTICLMIVFENRNPLKTHSWLLVIILVPIAGILLYVFFGRNYRKQKIYSRKSIADSEMLSDFVARQMVSLPSVIAGESSEIQSKDHLMRLLLNNNRSVLTLDNTVMLLKNGYETFPVMKDAIAGAKSYIHLEFYRIEPDILGTEFKDLLKQKASEGVQVKVIYDDVGSWNIGKSYLKEMRASNVSIYPFMPVRFPSFSSKVNYRNHRKILVVDGNVGFVGGLNIADKYLHGLPGLGPWKDTHLELKGESVAALNSIFLADWDFVSGKPVSEMESYLKYEKTGNRCLVQVASSGPDTDWATIMQVYFAAIATAKTSIYLTSPYFSPDESLLTALKTAALSGVDIRIIFPRTSDSIIANWNTRSYIGELLEAGVRIYLFNNGFIHSKYLLVDSVFASVGSPNVDIRSFDLDFEVTALIYDWKFATELNNLFFEDLKGCSEVVASEWEKRNRKERYKESLARIFGPLY
ncbi:MAG TPA: cardiolipin synthase [Bacteroidales bacterium]|nr:cardiolipin synthase [Bacteroidales bacterium]